MIYKKYGNTGLDVSAVGFGGMRFDLEKSQEENAELIKYAFDKGINYFDTAPGYCEDQSEDIFGLAFDTLLRGRRDEFYVSTKGMPTSFDTADKARLAVEKSLKRLKVDKIDFYHVWCIRKFEHYELAMMKGGQYEGLLKCQEEGLIENIVVSSHLRGSTICDIMNKGQFAGVLLGANILNFPYRWDAVQYAYDHGYGVVAMNPLAGGMIPANEDKLVFLSRDGLSPTEAALAFCIGCPQITVTLNGFTTREHIDTACRVADICSPFSDGEIETLRGQVSEKMNAICTGCGYCLAECPKKIPIAAYMQFYNQKQMFGKSDEELIKAIGFAREWGYLAERFADAKDCFECGACEDACTQHLNIIERLREIAIWEEKSSKLAESQQVDDE